MERTCSLVEGCPNPDTSGGGCIPHKFGNGIRVNGMTLFRHDRELGVTQAQKLRETFDASKRDKKDIQRVRGRRTATEVRRNGVWEKA